MALSTEEVKKIAELARLGLSEEEVKKLSSQLTGILNYVEILKELDTDKVQPTFQVTGLENVSREDQLEHGVQRDDLLACTELPVTDNQIKVKNVF